MATRPEKFGKSASWRRFILSLLVLAWVNASAGPCLMVMDAPAAEPMAGMHDGHAGHHAAADSVDDCDHCPPDGAQAAPPCDAGYYADCGALPDAGADTRKTEFKFKSLLQPGAPPPYPQQGYDPGRHLLLPVSDPGLLRRNTGPSLSIRYCVFLK